jgi:hypothetical protein
VRGDCRIVRGSLGIILSWIGSDGKELSGYARLRVD